MNPRLSLRNLAIALVISILFSSVGLPVKTNGASNPLAAFTYESCVACVPPGDVVSFNGNWSSSSSSVVSYDWDFGDGTSGTGAIITHSYSAESSYRIVLTLLTSYGNPSVSKTLTVGQSNSNVVYTVITDKDTYVTSDTVHIKLNATNQGSQPTTFTFADACSGFQFQITDSTGSLVYTNMPPPFAPCAQVITVITIQPGQTMTVGMLDWKQVNQQGQPVPAGSYTIIGVIHYESPYQTTPLASKTITIQAPDFQLTVNPASVVIAKGSATTLTITVTAVNGFTGTIHLCGTIQPANKHPPPRSPLNSVTLTAANPTGTTSLTITSTRSTNSGTYNVMITGTSGTISHTITATVTVASK